MKNEMVTIIFIAAIISSLGVGFVIGDGYYNDQEEKALVGMAYKMQNETYNCTDEDGDLSLRNQSKIRSIAFNGQEEFEDYCENSDLIGVREYYCAMGQVKSMLISCNCSNGECLY